MDIDITTSFKMMTTIATTVIKIGRTLMMMVTMMKMNDYLSTVTT